MYPASVAASTWPIAIGNPKPIDLPCGVQRTDTDVPLVGIGTMWCWSSTLVVAGSVHSVVRTPSRCTVGEAAAVPAVASAVAVTATAGMSHRSSRFIGENPLVRTLDKTGRTVQVSVGY